VLIAISVDVPRLTKDSLPATGSTWETTRSRSDDDSEGEHGWPATVIGSRPDREMPVPQTPHTQTMTTRQNEIEFSVLVDDDADPVVIRVSGELDSFSACELRAGIGDVLGSRGAILDIRDVPFVDSAGLGAIVGGIRRLREAGASVALCCTRSSVLRLLLMTGLDRIVAVTESPAQAREVIQGSLISQDAGVG
jgi:anti-sigma B factor antagonist